MENQGQYFKDTLNILTRYSWIYNFQLTRFLTDGIWKNLPDDWTVALCGVGTDELNMVPYGYQEDGWPDSLKEFLNTSIDLSVPRTPQRDITPVVLDQHMKRGMSPKKHHEVCQLAGLVDTVCRQNNCSGIVDVGSGLGYLSLTLSHQLGYTVLGIECEESRCQGADLRASKLSPEKLTRFQSEALWLKDTEESCGQLQSIIQRHFHANENVKYDESSVQLIVNSGCSTVHCDICNANKTGDNKQKEASTKMCSCHEYRPSADVGTPAMQKSSRDENPQNPYSLSFAESPSGNCSEELSLLTRPVEPLSHPRDCPTQVCLIGLHCCGDLSPTMLRLFTQVEELRSMVLLGCCYHRMTAKGDGSYHQFPMSSSLRQIMTSTTETRPTCSINQYALRLAAQETRSRWRMQTSEDHEFHKNNVAFRGILDQVFHDEDIQLLKEKRKLASKQKCTDFESYVDVVLERISVEGHMEKHKLREKLLEKYHQNMDHYKLIEPFTCLQVVLQGLIESMILWDRVQYLQEHGIHARLVSVMEDRISPRNMAIVATKPS